MGKGNRLAEGKNEVKNIALKGSHKVEVQEQWQVQSMPMAFHPRTHLRTDVPMNDPT